MCIFKVWHGCRCSWRLGKLEWITSLGRCSPGFISRLIIATVSGGSVTRGSLPRGRMCTGSSNDRGVAFAWVIVCLSGDGLRFHFLCLKVWITVNNINRSVVTMFTHMNSNPGYVYYYLILVSPNTQTPLIWIIIHTNCTSIFTLITISIHRNVLKWRLYS